MDIYVLTLPGMPSVVVYMACVSSDGWSRNPAHPFDPPKRTNVAHFVLKKMGASLEMDRPRANGIYRVGDTDPFVTITYLLTHADQKRCTDIMIYRSKNSRRSCDKSDWSKSGNGGYCGSL